MKVSPTTRNTMSRMISDIRLQGNVSSVTSVKAVSPIDTKNNAMSFTSSELMKETFYDKLTKKEQDISKEKPQDTTKQQTAVKRENNARKSIYNVSEQDRETLNFMKSMIERFNKSIDTVKRIDLARNQDNFFNIKSTIEQNSRFLSSIGVTTDKLGHFMMKEDEFVYEIMKNPQKISTLLEPSTGVIRKICDSFGGMLEY